MRYPPILSAPRLIRNEAEYDAVVAEVDRLLDEGPAVGSAADERLEFLSVLVEHYDQQHYQLPGGDVSPAEVVAEVLVYKGLTRADLAAVMGGRSRVSEFFSGSRALSMGQVVKLRELLGISADLLVGRVEPSTASKPRVRKVSEASKADRKAKPKPRKRVGR